MDLSVNDATASGLPMPDCDDKPGEATGGRCPADGVSGAVCGCVCVPEKDKNFFFPSANSGYWVSGAFSSSENN